MTARVDDQPAFILHRRDYSNSSLILELLTADHGRVGVLAKGARRRKDVGSFQPGCRLSVGWRGQGELKTLSAIESRHIPLPPDCYLPLFYVNELLIALTVRFDPLPGLFAHYQHLLLSFGRDDLQTALRGFEIELLEVLGLMPVLDRDRAGAELAPQADYVLDPAGGLSRCAEPRPDSAPGRLWCSLAARHFEVPEVRDLARRALRQIIDSNLAGRELQSRSLFLQLTRRDR